MKKKYEKADTITFTSSGKTNLKKVVDKKIYNAYNSNCPLYF